MKNTSDQNSNLFRQSSTTYFFSSLFFPPQLQKEITTLYAFVRTADNFVDQVPADKKNFVEFQKQALQALQNKKVKIPIITTFVTQAQKYHFKTEWVTAFLKAMAADLTVKNYKNLPLLQGYMYGSASVIGLMIARLLNLPAQAFPFADLLGQAMQLTNFIRDIQEDLSLGRVYLPQEDRQKFGVKHLPPQTAQQKNSLKN
jgi:phytoene synthase